MKTETTSPGLVVEDYKKEKQKRGEAPFLVSSFVNESSSYSHVKIVPLQSGSSG